MVIKVGVRRAAGLVAASLLLAAGLSGCGSAEKVVACGKVLAALNSISSEAAAKGSDVQGLKQVYDDGAVKIRDAAKGSEIEDEAESTAAAMEKVGKQLSDFTANPTATLPQVDTKGLLDAGTALQNACK